MIVIQVKYYGPTNTRPARLIARSAGCKPVWVPYEHAKDVSYYAVKAAAALCKREHWTQTFQGGATWEGYSFFAEAGLTVSADQAE